MPRSPGEGDRSSDLEAGLFHDAGGFELPFARAALVRHNSASASQFAGEALEWIISRGASVSPATTARKLLDEFGTVGAVLAARPGRIRRLTAEDPSAATEIKNFHSAMLGVLREEVASRPVFGNWPALLQHLRREMGYDAAEQFRVLYLDAQGGLITEEVASLGSVDIAVVHVREIVLRALDVGAASLIVVHNHPSGDARPSEADVALTKHLVTAAQLFEVTVVDHLIITAGTHTSMRAEGVIQ